MDLSPTDLIAGLALAVSCVAAWTTWHVHKDSGGRVKVKMNAVAYVPYSGTGKLMTTENGAFLLQETRQPYVELAQIVVENPGRTGVTVTGVQLRVQGLSRGPYAVMPRLFRLEGFESNTAKRETYFRLEPYDRRTLLLDVWSVVDGEFEKDPSLRELTIHAEVFVAGHDHPFDSTQHGNWRIQRGYVSAVGGHTVRRPRNIILTEFLRRNFSDLRDLNNMDQFAITAEDTADPSWNYDQFKEHLGMLLKKPSMDLMQPDDEPILHHVAAYEIYTELQRLGEQAKPFPLHKNRKQYYQERGLTPRKDIIDAD